MAKRLSEKQKEEIIKSFIRGNTLDQLSREFSCTNLTISRNLKKCLGEEKYKNFINKSKLQKESPVKKEKNDLNAEYLEFGNTKNIEENIFNNDSLLSSSFVEISPLEQEIDNLPQKDLSSIPISEIEFPKTVYMIVDNKTELETKFLRDYSEWDFLSQDDLDRKTLKIYFDIKIAKKDCNRDQKVIKVPNPNVFKIVAPILISRGISRIVSEDNLIKL